MEAANLGALAPDRAGLTTRSNGSARCRRSGPTSEHGRGWRSTSVGTSCRRHRSARRLAPRPQPRHPDLVLRPRAARTCSATAIGKYFSNAIREDGLLSRATAGLVVLEGAAGTVQEVFQALTPRFYATRTSTTPRRRLPPLVLVGQEYWTDTVPIWAAVRALGQGRPLGDAIHLVDTIEEAAAVVTAASTSRRGAR